MSATKELYYIQPAEAGRALAGLGTGTYAAKIPEGVDCAYSGGQLLACRELSFEFHQVGLRLGQRAAGKLARKF